MNQPAGNNDKQDSQGENDDGNWWIILSTPSKDSHKNQTQDHENQRGWFRKLWTRISQVKLSEWLMVVFTGVIAWYAGLQYRGMRGAGQQTKDLITAADRQAIAAESFKDSAASINTAIEKSQQDMQSMAASAENTQKDTAKQLIILQDQFRLDQRPVIWLAATKDATQDVIEVKQEPVIGTQMKQIVVNFLYENFGKSPTNVVWQKRGIATGPKALANIQVRGPIMADEFMPTGGIDFISFFTPPMTDQQITDAFNTDNGVVIRIEFYYRDSLGHDYESDLCESLLRTKAWSGCQPTDIKDCSKEKCDK